MSDFLNNLVARTLNLAPVVQPRLASRFEPVNPPTATVPDESVEVEAPAATRVAAQTETRAAESQPIVAPAEREHSRVDFQQVLNTVRNTYVEHREVVRPQVESIVPAPQKVAEPATIIETAPQIGPRINADKTDLGREATEKPRTVVVKETEDWRRVEPRVRNLIDSRLRNVQPVKANDTSPREAPAKAVTPRSVTRIEPAPIVPSQRLEVPPALPSEPSETINVTIGRVDVRAVFSQQATPPATRPRATSVNSLDDYLKQRSEGPR